MANGIGDLVSVGEMLDDDVVDHFGGRSPQADDYKGKQEVFGFWGRQSSSNPKTAR